MLCQDLRNLTITDIEIAGDPNIAERLSAAVKDSIMSWCGLVDEQVVAIWGIYGTNLIAGEYALWMLTTNEADKHPLVLARHSKRILSSLLEMTPMIHGFVSCDYKRSIRWIKWLGFELGPAQKWEKGYVRKFKMERKNGSVHTGGG